MIDKLASSSLVSGKNNVAFLSFFIRGELEQCLELLISTRRMPEAAFFARSYLPSKLPQVRQHAIILKFSRTLVLKHDVNCLLSGLDMVERSCFNPFWEGKQEPCQSRRVQESFSKFWAESCGRGRERRLVGRCFRELCINSWTSIKRKFFLAW